MEGRDYRERKGEGDRAIVGDVEWRNEKRGRMSSGKVQGGGVGTKKLPRARKCNREKSQAQGAADRRNLGNPGFCSFPGDHTLG